MLNINSNVTGSIFKTCDHILNLFCFLNASMEKRMIFILGVLDSSTCECKMCVCNQIVKKVRIDIIMSSH